MFTDRYGRPLVAINHESTRSVPQHFHVVRQLVPDQIYRGYGSGFLVRHTLVVRRETEIGREGGRERGGDGRREREKKKQHETREHFKREGEDGYSWIEMMQAATESRLINKWCLMERATFSYRC